MMKDIDYSFLAEHVYGYKNIYLNPKYIRAYRYVEEYRKKHPNQYCFINDDYESFKVFPLPFIRNKKNLATHEK